MSYLMIGRCSDVKIQRLTFRVKHLVSVYINPFMLQPLSDQKVPSGEDDLTVYLGAPLAKSTPLGLAPLKQAVVNVSDELLQFWKGCIH